MNCPHCNREIPDGSTFCGYCGNKITPAANTAAVAGVPQPSPVPTPTPTNNIPNGVPVQGAQPNAADYGAAADQQGGTKTFDVSSLRKNKLILICAGAAVALILLIVIIIIAASSGGGSSKDPVKGNYYYIRDGKDIVFFYNGVQVKTDFSSDCFVLSTSVDGTKMLIGDDSELVLIDKGKTYSITDDLYDYEARLSDSGAVAYISDESLYVYSGPGGKSKEIAELDEPDNCRFTISPDGGTVVFCEYDYWTGKYDYLSAWNGSKVIDLDSKFTPYFVSNGGKLICGVNSNGKFTFIKNLKAGSSESLKDCGTIRPVSADYSKVFYTTNSGDSYYFDSSLSDSIKISSKSFTVLLPGNYGVFPANVKNFYARCDGGIYYFFRTKDSYDSDRLIRDVYNPMLSADGKTILYMDDDELVKVSVSKPDNDDVIAKNIRGYDCDPSLKYVYYLDSDRELRFVAKDNKKIASDVTAYAVSKSGVCVFVSDEDLYYSSRGGEKTKISGVSDVEDLVYDGNYFYVRTEDTLYISSDGKKFTKAYDF